MVPIQISSISKCDGSFVCLKYDDPSYQIRSLSLRCGGYVLGEDRTIIDSYGQTGFEQLVRLDFTKFIEHTGLCSSRVSVFPISLCCMARRFTTPRQFGNPTDFPVWCRFFLASKAHWQSLLMNWL
jgi:hypothetical protein